MSRVAVIQSNYIPWKGYFDIIHDVDQFIFYDDVQYTKNDWRNRNKIKTPKGAQWLTIPTGAHNDLLIHQVTLDQGKWRENHWKTLEQFYAKAPHFQRYAPVLKPLYLEGAWTHLSDLNQRLIRVISTEFLGLSTEFKDSREFKLEGGRNERLLELVVRCGAKTYFSGPAARDYLDLESFKARGVEVVFKDYSGYPEYPQFFPPFNHGVTVLDLLFQTGPEAPHYIWGWREKAK